MKIVDFSFFADIDPRDSFYANWSRQYEYPWVISRLRAYGAKSVHNTACGGSQQIHGKFAIALGGEFKTTNSDVFVDSSWFVRDYCDITIPRRGEKFDAVVCVSAIEHINGHAPIEIIKNLLGHVNDGGIVLITLDSPPVNIAQLANELKCGCRVPENILTCSQEPYVGTNVVRLEIIK